MSNNTIPIDLNKEKMILLLKRLKQGRLEIEDAKKLQKYVIKEIEKSIIQKDEDYQIELNELLTILDMYVKGKVDLEKDSISDFYS
ncbi:MAG: hypothetical protein ACPKPY_09575 [Nitrososphaeraceae archaeon]